MFREKLLYYQAICWIFNGVGAGGKTYPNGLSMGIGLRAQSKSCYLPRLDIAEVQKLFIYKCLITP